MKTTKEKRHDITLKFLQKHIPLNSTILDLGKVNDLAKLMGDLYDVYNTKEGLDLDEYFDGIERFNIITAFEIFEHMHCPFGVLNKMRGRLVVSVPLKLWFASAYWGEDKLNRHYQEYEQKQFDALLERTGWNIKDSMKFVSFDNKIGIRPILRRFTNRYYLIYAEK